MAPRKRTTGTKRAAKAKKVTARAAAPELRAAMDDSLKAYEAGNKRFFSYLAEDVRVFGLDSPEPIVGRKAFERAFGAGFATRRQATPTFQDVAVNGDQAVLSQVIQVTANNVTVPVRQTVVWQRGADGEWLMTHIHNARAGQAISLGGAPRSPEAVRVLNERIATVAATVGVAQ